jgi:hypothetical protein
MMSFGNPSVCFLSGKSIYENKNKAKVFSLSNKKDQNSHLQLKVRFANLKFASQNKLKFAFVN